MEEGGAGRDELGLQCATSAFDPGMWGCVSDARGFVGWSRREWVAEAGGSVRGFKQEKQASGKGQLICSG